MWTNERHWCHFRRRGCRICRRGLAGRKRALHFRRPDAPTPTWMSFLQQRFPTGQTNAAFPTSTTRFLFRTSDLQQRFPLGQTSAVFPTSTTRFHLRMSDLQQRFPPGRTSAAFPTSGRFASPWMSNLQQRFRRRRTSAAFPTSGSISGLRMSNLQARLRRRRTSAAFPTSEMARQRAAGTSRRGLVPAASNPCLVMTKFPIGHDETEISGLQGQKISVSS